MIDKEQNKGEQHIHFNMKQWKVKGRFDIHNDISENVTLLKLMDTVGNVNNAVSIVGY